MVAGAAMLAGSASGGAIAQATNLGVPFLVRAGVLLAMFAVAMWLMHDVGFTPARSTHPLGATRAVLSASIDNGLKIRPVRYVMLAAPFSAGVGIYVFYALQPYLLELFGDPNAYSVAGLAAAIVAGALIFLVLGFTRVFWVALVLLAVWAIVDSSARPVRPAYINDMIPSKERATVLSFDSLMGSSGGAVVQPLLGRSADLYGYAASLAIAGVIQLLAVPFLVASRRQGSPADEANASPKAQDKGPAEDSRA
jgi:MFS family permease